LQLPAVAPLQVAAAANWVQFELVSQLWPSLLQDPATAFWQVRLALTQSLLIAQLAVEQLPRTALLHE
jgi:hypothetical protein